MGDATQPRLNVAPSPSKEDKSAHTEIILASVASLLLKLLKKEGKGMGKTMRKHFTPSKQQDVNV